MSWLNIFRLRKLRVAIARVKLIFLRRLEDLEKCPYYGCAYYICSPCPACGRHMAHGPFIISSYSTCYMGSCILKH